MTDKREALGNMIKNNRMKKYKVTFATRRAAIVKADSIEHVKLLLGFLLNYATDIREIKE